MNRSNDLLRPVSNADAAVVSPWKLRGADPYNMGEAIDHEETERAS